MKYAHTNIVARDWHKLADFYINVFECKPVLPERDLRGDWLDQATRINYAHLTGMHLRLPGFGDNGPTLEVFHYDELVDKTLPIIANRVGLGHIAFEVEDVVQTLEKLIHQGGIKFGEVIVQQIPGVGEITFTYAKDPEENLIEIQSWKYNS